MAPTEQNFTVQGMTCDHCVASVTEEVSEVAGVERVDVELTSGRMVVAGERFTEQQISAAVEEAGYEVAR
jgi:copper ion binding protein